MCYSKSKGDLRQRRNSRENPKIPETSDDICITPPRFQSIHTPQPLNVTPNSQALKLLNPNPQAPTSDDDRAHGRLNPEALNTEIRNPLSFFLELGL